MSITWQQGVLGGVGLAAGGTGLYFGIRWLAPRIGLVAKPAAPTGLRVVTNKAVSAKNGLLTVAIGAPTGMAAGQTYTIKWYHYYPATVAGKAVLTPKLIATTTSPELEFTFGKASQAGVLIDGVTPGRPYTWGAQICVGGACSPIVQGPSTTAASAAA